MLGTMMKHTRKNQVTTLTVGSVQRKFEGDDRSMLGRMLGSCLDAGDGAQMFGSDIVALTIDATDMFSITLGVDGKFETAKVSERDLDALYDSCYDR